MAKEALEALLNTLDVWLVIFGLLVAVGTVGGAVVGYIHWRKGNELQQLQSAENLRLQARIAEAEAQAAEANKKAEEERLARVKIEERLAPRRLTLDRLRRFLDILRKGPKGPVDIQFAANDAEASAFASQIRDALRNAGWDAHITAAFVSVESLQGLVVTVYNADRAPVHVAVLKNALEQVGFPVSVRPSDQSVPEGIVRLFVGQKP